MVIIVNFKHLRGIYQQNQQNFISLRKLWKVNLRNLVSIIQNLDIFVLLLIINNKYNNNNNNLIINRINSKNKIITYVIFAYPLTINQWIVQHKYAIVVDKLAIQQNYAKMIKVKLALNVEKKDIKQIIAELFFLLKNKSRVINIKRILIK